MADLHKIYLFRMCHIENIPHILQYGITHPISQNANSLYVSIGDVSLISTRRLFVLDNGRPLGDYIPFYFAFRTPMLFVIQKGYNLVTPTPAADIIYCVTSVQKIIEQRLDFIFTDGHAVDSFTTQYSPADLEIIDTIIDKKAINAKYWIDENDLDLKRRKEAEFLVLGDINTNSILGYVVFNQTAKDRMLTFGVQESRVHIEPNYYF